MISEQSPDGSQITTWTADTGDPARLFGILDHLLDLNITLISVTPSDNQAANLQLHRQLGDEHCCASLFPLADMTGILNVLPVRNDR